MPTDKQRRAATLAATSLGFGVIQLDVTVVNVAVERIGRALHATVAELQWIVSAYTLTFAALILTAGALGDRVGAKRVFCAGFAGFTAASTACGLAPDTAVLIAARALQGVGAALLGACSLALLNHAFPEGPGRARALGVWAAGASTALSGGPVVGGVLIATVGWRGIFFINLPLGAVGLWLTVRYARETSRQAHRRLDVPGAVTATIALATLAGGLIATPDLLGASAVAAALFAATQARGRTPMLPPALVKSPGFTRPGLVGLLANVCFYGLIFVFSLLFQRERGMSALATGLAFLPMTAAILVANLASGRVSAALGPGRTIAAGLVTMIAGCVAVLLGGPGVGYLALLGAGLGLLVPPLTGTLMASVERSRSGVASGALTTLRQTGSMVGVALLGTRGLHQALAISLGALAAALVVQASVSPRRIA